MRILTALLLLLLVSVDDWGQKASGVSTISPATPPVLQLYEKYVGNQSHLYNGSDFKSLPIEGNEHPFFLSNDWSDGNIFYDGQLYANQSLLYNLVTDQVITEDGASKNEIELIREKVGYFTIEGHKFVLTAGQDENMIGTGFYDLIYQGTTRVLVKRKKGPHEQVLENRVVHTYELKNKIFINTANHYIPIHTKKDLFQCFQSKESELKRHLKDKKLRFRHDRERFCIETASFYDSLDK